MEELLCVQNELKRPQLTNIAPVCRTSELKCCQQRPDQSTGEGWRITWLTSHWGLKSVSWTLVPIAVWGLWIPEIRDSMSSTACWLAGQPLKVSQGGHVGYPMLIHGTLRWLCTSKLSLCTERPDSSSSGNVLCPCALRTETSAPVIISSSIYSPVRHRLFQQYGVLCKFWSVQTELGEWPGNWTGFCWQGSQRHNTQEQHWLEMAWSWLHMGFDDFFKNIHS